MRLNIGGGGLNLYSNFFAKIFHGRSLSCGEIGCFASHFTLWHKCVNLNEAIVILEDDVEIKEKFDEGVFLCKKSSFDFVRLFALFENDEDTGFNICITKRKLGGAQGYYLTPNGARILISHAKKWVSPVDDFMDRYFIHKMPNAIFKPFLIVEKKMESTIGSSRNKKPKYFFKITREFVRVFWICKKFLFDIFHS